MKTVKFYNKTTGRWEPIAGISTLGGVSDYNDLSNKPDLSVYALKSELEALREELTNLINSQEPDSQYYTEYTIDNSVSTFSLRSVDNPINNGQYIPQFSNGYDYIKITLADGNVTTNLNTSASEVEKIKIYYPAGTSYVKFTDTKVKDVEHIECSNFTDATSMFKNCVSLTHADLSTLDSSKVTVDTTMFTGVNTDVQLQFNDEWSYTNRDMGLIKMVDVVMHHYREDGLYENSSIYLKSQYDENPVQYVIRQVDPEDERWRYEPLSLEYDTSYEIYFEDNGNTGETMNARFMGNMDIFFVGATPNSFTESRPEIGGNEEPEVEYITGFNLQGKEMISLDGPIGVCDTVYITPNETGRPMNFVVEFPSSDWGIINYTYHNDEGNWRIDFFLNGTSLEADSTVTIKEVNSGITQDIRMVVDPKVRLFVHYKATDGNYENDHLRLSSDTETTMHDFVNEMDDYGVLATINIDPNVTYTAELDYNSGSMPLDGQIRISEDTHIWISDNSSEILYEKPNQPEEPSTYTLTINMYDPNGYSPSNMVFLEDAGGNRHTCYFSSSDQNDFGRYGSIELPGVATYSVDVQDVNNSVTRLSSDITMDSNKEIWVIAGDSTLYTERPEIGGGDEPEEPSQEYITGFDVDTSSITLDRIDRNLVQFNIYPHETGKQVSFSFSFEDVTYSNPDLLSAFAETWDYDSGNSTVYGNVCLQMDDSCTGTATLVVREDNSGTEQRISLEIVEPQPVITGLTMTPESAVMNAENNEVTFTLTPNETDRPVRFSYGWGPTSTISISEDSSEAPERYYFKLTGEKLYKEDLTFGIMEERSGIDVSSQLTVEAEHTYDEVHADLKVWYYSENQNFYGKKLVISSSESSNDAHDFRYSGDDQRVRYVNVTPPIGEPIEFRLEDHSGESESTVISTTVTINEDTQLWIIEGDSTLYTEQPEGWPQIEYATLTLHYNRKNGDYDNWHIWKWCSCGSHTTDGMVVDFTEEDDFGKIAYVEAVKGCNLGYIIRKGEWEDKNHSDDQNIQMDDNMEIWVTQGQNGYHTERPEIGGGDTPDQPEEPDTNMVTFTLHYEKPEI